MLFLAYFVVIVGYYDGQCLEYAIIPRLTYKYSHKWDDVLDQLGEAISNTGGRVVQLINQPYACERPPSPGGSGKTSDDYIYYI